MSAVQQEHADLTRADIEAALVRLRARPGFLRETPLWKLTGAHIGVPCAEVWLKLEHLQVGGSFKARGMFNRMLAQPIGPAGVIIASGGNAGIATAAAANFLGVPCEVFLPQTSSVAKRERLKQLGATVVVQGAQYAQAFEACVARQRESGALQMHAYDQVEVVAGSAALAAEIEQQGGVPDSVLVSVGGGGLIGGIAQWFASRAKVLALEPQLAPTLFAARKAGAPTPVDVSGVAADALGAKLVGNIGWAVAQRHVDDALLLDDAAIRAAQHWLWSELKLAVEPAAALGLAALHTRAYVPHAGERVCLVLCGANVDPATLA
jgi:threonine dehydratase